MQKMVEGPSARLEQLPDNLPSHLNIQGISAQDRSNIVAGIVKGNVNFYSSNHPQEAADEAARKCREALFQTDPFVDRENLISAKGKRVAGTCEWIAHNERYQSWLNDDGDNMRLLWISGGPGKGKTMMSVYLTEELERHTATIDNAELTFLFCSAQDKKRSTAVTVLCGLVHQILVKRPQLIKHALSYFDTQERTLESQLSLGTLWIIFSKLVADSDLGIMFCVLDGLDECDEDTVTLLLPKLVRLLNSKAPSSNQGTLKLVIVSRDIPGLQGCSRIQLDPVNDHMVASDVERFISTRIEELSSIDGFDDKFRASIQTVLRKHARGTFLWVGFAMYELSQKQTCSEIWKALEDLPSGLPAIYGRMLLRIPAKQREVSRAILRWVTLAVRPLTLHELAGAVGIQPPSPHISLERATRDAIALCGSLLKIQEQGVSLVHQSAQDYLLRKEPDSNPELEAFRLEFEHSHLELAKECLNCIAQSDLWYRSIDLGISRGPQEPLLLRYAVIHWPDHAKSSSTLAIELCKFSEFFLEKESLLRAHWWETYNKTPRLCEDQLLNMACALEIVPWIQQVLPKRSWSSRLHQRVKKTTGNTALHTAARTGNEAVVVLLLENKVADVNAKNTNKETALHLAISRGDITIAQRLVEKGADVSAKDYDRNTALHVAASRGDIAMVQLIVERDVDINMKGYLGGTALHEAAREGHVAMVQLLVGLGADINAKDRYGWTVLYSTAASTENENMVRLLVELGADVNPKNPNGDTALFAIAAYVGKEAMVRLLAELGADVDAKNRGGSTALYWIANNTQEDDEAMRMVRLLAELGADVNARDDDGKTALYRARSLGREAMVRLLQGLGAGV